MRVLVQVRRTGDRVSKGEPFGTTMDTRGEAPCKHRSRACHVQIFKRAVYTKKGANNTKKPVFIRVYSM
jgi:hypothetical protein